MSTRCQIVIQADPDKPVKVSTVEREYSGSTFKECEVSGAYPFYVYKHSDGYPTGVLPVLVPFAKNFGEYRGHDPEYCVAQLIRAFAIADYEHGMACDAEEREKGLEPGGYGPDYKKGITHAESAKLHVTGWGVDAGIHGDIEYLYVVTSAGAVLTYSNEGKGWKLIKPKFGPELYVDVA